MALDYWLRHSEGSKIFSEVKPPLQLALLAQANGNLYRLLQPV